MAWNWDATRVREAGPRRFGHAKVYKPKCSAVDATATVSRGPISKDSENVCGGSVRP